MAEVSRRKPRRTGRTAVRARALFLEKIAAGYSVSYSAAAAGFSKSSAYEWRHADAEFAAAWDAATETGVDVLEDEARRRAVDGVAEPVVSAGRLVLDQDGKPIWINRFSDTLLALLLRGKRPAVYRDRVSAELSGPNGGAIELDAKARLAGKFAELFKPQQDQPGEC